MDIFFLSIFTRKIFAKSSSSSFCVYTPLILFFIYFSFFFLFFCRNVYTKCRFFSSNFVVDLLEYTFKGKKEKEMKEIDDPT